MNFSPYLFLILCSVIVASFAQVLLKKSAMKEHKSVIFEYLNVYVIVGYGMMMVGVLLNILAYRKVEYKNGPVIESLGFLFVMILSHFFFKEKITKKKVLGNLIILLGIVIFYI